MIDVVGLRSLGKFRLAIEFSDGAAGTHDFAGLLHRNGAMIEALKDPRYFKRVFIEDGVLTWPNGYDWDSEALHEEMAKAGELSRVAAAE